MFILLALILTVISLSLRLGASGVSIGNKVRKRAVRSKGEPVKGLESIASTLLDSSLRLSEYGLKTLSFLVARCRDLVLWVGSFVLVLDIIILVIVIVSASFTLMFTESGDDGLLELSSQVVVSEVAE